MNDALRQARLNAGLSQKQAAEVCHVTVETWGRWERGIYPMPASQWELFTLRTGAYDAEKAH